MSNSVRKPKPKQQPGAVAGRIPVVHRQKAKVVPIVGLRISEPKRSLTEIYERGLFRYTEGLFEEAYHDFKQASRDPQKLVSCILMASRCYRRRGMAEKAIALLKTAALRNACSEEDAALYRKELMALQPATAPTVAKIAPAEASAEPVQVLKAVQKEVAVEPAAEYRAPVDLYAAPTRKLITVPFGLAVTALLTAGYLARDEQHLIAESGLGYLLGIIGSFLMLVLMLYPLRKNMRFMRNWGPIPQWFRFHMLAGIIGPVMILFHANFQLGSLNSKVVLWSTLLVAGSGIFGRYLYTKIHYGLYGKRISLEQLHNAISANQDNLAAVFIYAPKIKKRLLHFDETVMRPESGLFGSIWRVFMIDLLHRWTHLRIAIGLRRAIKVAARRNHWSRRETRRQFRVANRLISRHFKAVLKVAEFSFYERFFSLWHILHMPLFLLLVVALVIHVVAVHMY